MIIDFQLEFFGICFWSSHKRPTQGVQNLVTHCHGIECNMTFAASSIRKVVNGRQGDP